MEKKPAWYGEPVGVCSNLEEAVVGPVWGLSKIPCPREAVDSCSKICLASRPLQLPGQIGLKCGLGSESRVQRVKTTLLTVLRGEILRHKSKVVSVGWREIAYWVVSYREAVLGIEPLSTGSEREGDGKLDGKFFCELEMDLCEVTQAWEGLVKRTGIIIYC